MSHAPSSEGHRAVGLSLALGATFGAGLGALIGSVTGDFGHWIGMGIPFGICIGLAAGAMFSRPDRRGTRSGVATIPWPASDDDAIPLLPRSRNQL